MDTLTLQRHTSTDLPGSTVVRLLVNGQDLIELVRAVELSIPEAEPEIAGGYKGLPPEEVRPPSRHLLGEPDPLYAENGKVVLLVCGGCGEVGCWPFLARISVSSEQVTWSEFEQPHRPHWRYDTLGPFVFDLQQYEHALSHWV